MAKKSTRKQKPKYGSWISKKRLEEFRKELKKRRFGPRKTKKRFEHTLKADSKTMCLTVAD